MDIYSHCPTCGYDKVFDSFGKQTGIRKCFDCGRMHCSECEEAKRLQNYVCPYCKSSNIKPIGCIRKG